MSENTMIYCLMVTTSYLDNLWPLLLQGQTKVATPKSAYNSLIIGHTGYGYEANHRLGFF